MSATVVAIDRQPDAAAPPEPDGYPRDLDELHTKLVERFEEAERASQDARAWGEQARSYYCGQQWTADEQKALRDRGQPCIVVNKILDKVQLLCGLERKARTDPKAFPRTPTEEDRADAATQALRYVADDNKLPLIRSDVFENMLVEGFGGAEAGLRPNPKGGYDITWTRVPWDRIWYDPHSAAKDFSDALYTGIVIWMDEDQLRATYPGADDVIDATFTDYGSYADKPNEIAWTDNRRKRCRVLTCHWTERSEWWEATYTRGGLLTHPVRSPFKDARGQSACRLILQSAYVDRENNRFGAVRNWMSLQDEINKRRSKALHLLSVRQMRAERGAFEDVDAARRQLAKPDGILEPNPGFQVEIMPGGDLATGQFQLLQHAEQAMQLTGPNAAMSGTDSRELSGRAVLAQQAGGAVQNEPLADSLRWWSRRVYEMSWMAVREYWTGGKWVRVTDSLNDTRWVGINRPVTLADELAAMPPPRRAAVMQQMQLMPNDPRLAMVVRVENDITDLDVDITIEEGMDLPTMAAENFQTLVQLASLQPGLIPGDVLIAASSLRDKNDLLERMKQHQEQQAQQQAQMAPLMQRAATAKVSETESKAAANFALAHERQTNVVRNVHDVRAEHDAPPYGLAYVAPDPPSEMAGFGAGAQDPNQLMSPEMAAAHQAAELRGKHAQAAANEAAAVQRMAQARATLNPPAPPAGSNP